MLTGKITCLFLFSSLLGYEVLGFKTGSTSEAVDQIGRSSGSEQDGGITPIEEIQAVKAVSGDFGHPSRGDTLIRKLNENREYLNPPINVFMPSSTAQQVLVRQALARGQSLGRIPDLGSNAKQFLAMGETANKAIDALKKLPQCVVGHCGGSQIQTFGGSHLETETDFAKQNDAQGDEMSPEQRAILDQIQGIDLHFNEPAFENTKIEPKRDSPDIEPSFYWKSPPKGVEGLPIGPPDPLPGPFTSKSDIIDPKEMILTSGEGTNDGPMGCFNNVNWESILGWVLSIIMGCAILYILIQIACCISQHDIAEMLNGCGIIESVRGSMSGRASQDCQPGFDLCDYFPKAATQGGSECDPLAMDVCDFVGGGGQAGSGQGSQGYPSVQATQGSQSYQGSQEQQLARVSEGGAAQADDEEPEEIVDEFLRSKFGSRRSMEPINQFYAQTQQWNRQEDQSHVRQDSTNVAPPSGQPSIHWAASHHPPGTTSNVVHFTAAAPEPQMQPRSNQALPYPQPAYPVNQGLLRHVPSAQGQRPVSILRPPSQGQYQQGQQQGHYQQFQQQQGGSGVAQQFQQPGQQFQQPGNHQQFQQGNAQFQQQANAQQGYYQVQPRQQTQFPPRGYYGARGPRPF